MYEWLFEDAIKAGVCNDVSYCIAHYQTLISGIAAVFAAILTAGIVYWSASMPVRQQQIKDADEKKSMKKVAEIEMRVQVNQIDERLMEIKDKIETCNLVNQSSFTPNIVIFKFPEYRVLSNWNALSLIDDDILGLYFFTHLKLSEYMQFVEGTKGHEFHEYSSDLSSRLEKVKSSINDLKELSVF